MADAKSIVEKLYRAFNDPGFLGMGGTDEEGVLEALRLAKDQEIMKDVDTLYTSTYPGELNLKDEIDDELSGDDFDAAMKLYDEGMKAEPKAQPAAAGSTGGGRGTSNTPIPQVPVLGTMVPRPAQCILEFGIAGSEYEGGKKATLVRRRMNGTKYGSDQYDQAETVQGKPGSFGKLEYPEGNDYKFWFWGQITPKRDSQVYWKVQLGLGYRILLTINRIANSKTPHDAIDVTNITEMVGRIYQGTYHYSTDRQYRTFWEADLRILDASGAEL